jgi:serine/threonine protein phosphatase 1
VAVIGDIHGDLVLLDRLLARLGDMPVLFAGDVCDRGPDTRGVVERLIARKALGIRGNHEDWVRAWLGGDGFDRFALHTMMGGEQTLRSYGVEGRMTGDVNRQRGRVPAHHAAFYLDLPVAIDLTVGDRSYWLVHAGVPCSEGLRGMSLAEVVPWLAEHRAASLLWGASEPDMGLPVDRTVIMGHMAQRRPLDLGFVIAVDTGCSTTHDRALTAVILPERRFVTVMH